MLPPAVLRRRMKESEQPRNREFSATCHASRRISSRPFAAAERKSSRDALEELDRAGHFSTSTTCFPPWQDDRPRWLLVSTADHHDLSISDHRMSLSPRGTAQQAVGAVFGRLG